MKVNLIEIEIRRLSHNDLDKVMGIEPLAFGSHHWSWQSFANELNNTAGMYFAAINRQTNELVGYSGFWLVVDEAHITTLAVHPDFRRQHIGEQLLLEDITQAYAAGARRITLEVRVSNNNAQDLYVKYGFKNLGMRQSYYKDNAEDALVLWTENITQPTFVNTVKDRVLSLHKLGALSTERKTDILSNKFFTIMNENTRQQSEASIFCS